MNSSNIYLHAVNFSSVACDGSNISVSLASNWECSRWFQAGEWSNHGRLSWWSSHSDGGEHRGSHSIFSFSFLLLICLLLWSYIYIVGTAWTKGPGFMITSLTATGLWKGVDTFIKTDHYDDATSHKILLSYLFLVREWVNVYGLWSILDAMLFWVLPFGRKESDAWAFF